MDLGFSVSSTRMGIDPDEVACSVQLGPEDGGFDAWKVCINPGADVRAIIVPADVAYAPSVGGIA